MKKKKQKKYYFGFFFLVQEEIYAYQDKVHLLWHRNTD
jgi:hypothetical protein